MRWWRRNTLDDPLRLMPIGIALLLMLALAASAVVLLGVATVAVLGLPRPDPRGPTVAELLEALKIALALVAGIGVVVALVVAYRRHWTTRSRGGGGTNRRHLRGRQPRRRCSYA